ALSHPIDSSLNPGCAPAHGSHCACCSHSEIVMSVEVDWDLWSDPFAGLANQDLHAFRSPSADGINHYDLCRPCFECGCVDLLQERKVRSCAIYSKKSDSDCILLRE